MNAPPRMTRRSVALLGGAAVPVAVWLVVVPWDLSEIDASGAMIEGGGDDNAGSIATVAVVVLAMGVVLALLQQTRTVAELFTFGGFIAWAALFGWRAGSSRVIGANFFMIPLLFAVVPAAIIVPLFVRWVARRSAEYSR